MMLTKRPHVNCLGKNCVHMFIPLECHTPNYPGMSWRIHCPSLPSASYDWVQYPVHHIIVLFRFRVGILTEVDLRPSVQQIAVITSPTTTCLYPGGTDMRVHITTTGNPFAHRSSAPLVHSQRSCGGTISAPSDHKDWQSFFKCSRTSVDLSILSHKFHKAQDKASAMFSDSLIHLGGRMAFQLNALVTTSEDCEGNTAQWRRQARVIMQDFFSMYLPTDLQHVPRLFRSW